MASVPILEWTVDPSTVLTSAYQRLTSQIGENRPQANHSAHRPAQCMAVWENSSLRPVGNHLAAWSMRVNTSYYLDLNGHKLYKR